ncbi:protein RDM1-like [Prunus dulcis]|uniref:protein RDM1-like n=1 Tax=Prunus dulcis TaxID=3755 RepID=UPI001482D188|nr:protein RDM1-like [Prunus dulcis]
MLRQRRPLHYQHLLVSDSETESDDLSEHFKVQTSLIKRWGKRIAKEGSKSKRKNKEKSNEGRCGSARALKEDPEVVLKIAKHYQEQMKHIPIPKNRRKDAVFVTWWALANSMKQFYGQPLHYMTQVLVKQWDESRIGSAEEEKPMDNIIHPRRAESTIWDVEQVHRQCTSHIHLAKLWLSDPDYYAFVDEVIPSSKLVA